MRLHFLLKLLIAFFIPNICLSQNLVWEAPYLNNYENLEIYDFKKSLDGGFLVCGGYDLGFRTGGILIKTDSLGNELWSHVFTNANSPLPKDFIYTSVAQSKDSTIFCSRFDEENLNNDYHKYHPDGTPVVGGITAAPFEFARLGDFGNNTIFEISGQSGEDFYILDDSLRVNHDFSHPFFPFIFPIFSQFKEVLIGDSVFYTYGSNGLNEFDTTYHTQKRIYIREFIGTPPTNSRPLWNAFLSGDSIFYTWIEEVNSVITTGLGIYSIAADTILHENLFNYTDYSVYNDIYVNPKGSKTLLFGPIESRWRFDLFDSNFDLIESYDLGSDFNESVNSFAEEHQVKVIQSEAKPDEFYVYNQGKIQKWNFPKFISSEVSADALAQQKVEEILFSPNPVKDIFRVEYQEKSKAQVLIYSTTGQLVSDYILEQPGVINLSYLPPGTYLCRVRTKGSFSSKPFIKL